MQVCNVKWGFAAAAIMALCYAPSVGAADASEGRTVAERMVDRAKEPESQAGDSQGLTDSRVRIMMSYAWNSLDGELTKQAQEKGEQDAKRDPAKYLVPVDESRKIIRAAMRSAYAQLCGLEELEQKNYATLMKSELDRNVWSSQQMQFIDALHLFSLRLFTDRVAVQVEGEKEETIDGSGKAACTPEKKQEVTQEINEFLQSAEASQAPIAKPVTPNSAGAN
jgi:hypothetical protein